MSDVSTAPLRTSREPLPPFQWLVDEHAGAVLRYLVRHVGPDSAEDCFQDTMLAALRAYPSLAHGANLRGWLITIAKRKALDALRAPGRRNVPIDAGSVTVAGPDRADREPELWDAVRSLPTKQRRAVGLRFAADRPYDEIASTMSISEAAARRNVHEGIKKLRRQIDDND